MSDALRVLLLEDSGSDAELNEHALRRAGLNFVAQRVQRRQEFLAALEEFRPDVILADYQMPEFDGLQALMLVREGWPHLPFIFVSGAMGEERAVASLREGASDYVLKDRLARLPDAVLQAIDVASRKRQLWQTERALEASEARFRALVETTSDWIWEVDAQSRYRYVSPASLSLLGYAPEDLIGRTPFELMAPDEAARVRLQFDEIVAARRPFALLENTCLHRDGQRVVLETSGMPFFTPEGGFAGYRGVDRDISERKRAEASLRLQARRAEALLELPRAADELDETAFMQRGQELAEELTGSQIAFIHFVNDDQETLELVTWSRRTLENYCQATFDKHYPVSQAGIWADALRQRQAVVINDYAAALGKHGLPQGHARLDRLISVPVMEGGLVRMMTGVGNKASDYDDMDVETVQLISNEIWRIVRQRRAEATLRKLAQAVEQSPESIVITNLAAEIEYVNAAFLAVTGYKREEVLGQNPRILHSGKTARATYDALWEAMQQGRPWKGEFCNKRRDGSEYVEFAIITPLRQLDGSISHYVAVKEDITQKKRNAAELDQHRLHLEELVASRTTELRATQQEAERLARVKSEFLANMSHEIRTPLNAVLGFAQVGMRDSIGRHAMTTFSRIVDAGQLLLRVVNDILDFSKIEAGKLVIEQGRLHPLAILDRCVELVRDSAQSKGLELRVEAAADLPASCQGDELRLSQVLMNLLTNAIKFTEHGSISLSAGRRSAGLQEQLWFRVADSGIGMNAEEQSRLFRAFEQADGSTTRRFGGTGLGLAISQRLMNLMGGKVEVRSSPGSGSVFEVLLPSLDAEGLAAHLPPATPAPDLSGPKLQGTSILVAEDNEVNRLVLEDLLAREGCRLTQVENGLLAVNLVRQQGATVFDVVLMDIQMPVMDGLEATRQIKALAPELPVIGLTAHALAEEREKCLAAGMVAHVAKPIVLANLIGAIRQQLGKGAVAAENTAPVFTSLHVDWRAVELHYQGRQEFLARLLAAIVQGNADKPALLLAACASRDFEQLVFHGHTLKGMAGDVLPGTIRALAGTMEAAAHKNEDIAFGHAQRLAQLLRDFLEEVAAYLGRDGAALPESATPEAVDWEEMDALLKHLYTLLASSDTAVNASYVQAAARLHQAFGEEAGRLGALIQAYDYENAMQSLIKIQVLARDQPCP